MGMDIYGKKPTSPDGEYFRASVWTWPAIHSLTMMLCWDLLDKKTLQLMAHNEGAGSDDPDTCKQMARRLKQWIKENPAGYSLHVEHEHTPEGRIAESLANAGWNVVVKGSTSVRSVDAEHVQEWATFLYHCGGFEVW